MTIYDKNLYAKSLYFDATMITSTRHGFRKLEYSNEGNPYRWTGANGSECDLTFEVDRLLAKQVELSFLRTTPRLDNDKRGIVGYVDNEQIEFNKSTDKDLQIYKTKLPKLYKNRPTVLHLKIPTFIPAMVDKDSTDERELGLPFVSLSVF